MSDSWQDRDFSFGVFEEEEIEKPIRSKRFARSVYSKENGVYVGEVTPFIPVICTLFGLLLFGFGIFGFLTMNGDDKTVSLLIGFFLGGICNFFGFIGLSAYFTGITYAKSRRGGGSGGDAPDTDTSTD